ATTDDSVDAAAVPVLTASVEAAVVADVPSAAAVAALVVEWVFGDVRWSQAATHHSTSNAAATLHPCNGVVQAMVEKDMDNLQQRGGVEKGKGPCATDKRRARHPLLLIWVTTALVPDPVGRDPQR
ncbi:MAG: hypothetical protein AAFX99_29480, partial [Myxococcota bacterium]